MRVQSLPTIARCQLRWVCNWRQRAPKMLFVQGAFETHLLRWVCNWRQREPMMLFLQGAFETHQPKALLLIYNFYIVVNSSSSYIVVLYSMYDFYNFTCFPLAFAHLAERPTGPAIRQAQSIPCIHLPSACTICLHYLPLLHICLPSPRNSRPTLMETICLAVLTGNPV
mgnify:CR=1 FL=1